MMNEYNVVAKKWPNGILLSTNPAKLKEVSPPSRKLENFGVRSLVFCAVGVLIISVDNLTPFTD
jgi:hypothetical protein